MRKRKITQKLREEMFLIYQETGSKSEVKKRLKLSNKAVEKYYERDNWEGRLRAIEEKVQEKIDNQVANRRLRNVKVLDMAIEDVMSQLEGARAAGRAGVVDPKLLSKLVATQDHLIGRGAADELDRGITPEAQRALNILATLGEEGLRHLGELITDKVVDTDMEVLTSTPPRMLPDISSGSYELDSKFEVKRKKK